MLISKLSVKSGDSCGLGLDIGIALLYNETIILT